MLTDATTLSHLKLRHVEPVYQETPVYHEDPHSVTPFVHAAHLTSTVHHASHGVAHHGTAHHQSVVQHHAVPVHHAAHAVHAAPVHHAVHAAPYHKPSPLPHISPSMDSSLTATPGRGHQSTLIQLLR